MNYQLVKAAIQKYGNKRENLLPILQDISKNENYLSENLMNEIAEEMGISPTDIFGTATFYSFFNIKPMGKNIIRICKTITCDMAGKEKIVQALEQRLKIKCGETTPDKKFSLTTTNCIGWCHKGPAMLVNDDVYTELTPEKAVSALEKYF